MERPGRPLCSILPASADSTFESNSRKCAGPGRGGGFLRAAVRVYQANFMSPFILPFTRVYDFNAAWSAIIYMHQQICIMIFHQIKRAVGRPAIG